MSFFRAQKKVYRKHLFYGRWVGIELTLSYSNEMLMLTLTLTLTLTINFAHN